MSRAGLSVHVWAVEVVCRAFAREIYEVWERISDRHASGSERCMESRTSLLLFRAINREGMGRN